MVLPEPPEGPECLGQGGVQGCSHCHSHTPKKGEPVLFDRDETPRPGTTMEKLGKLKAVMGGVCTAGNSSTENDGAAAVVVTSAEKAVELGIDALGMMRSCAVVGDDPRHTYATVPAAVKKALDTANLSITQIDLIRIAIQLADFQQAFK